MKLTPTYFGILAILACIRTLGASLAPHPVIKLMAAPSDSLPPIHSLQDKDIASIKPNIETDIIQIILKTGDTLTYDEMDWDLEDQNPSISPTVKEAIEVVKKIYTKVENPPQFAGGEKAWQSYMKEFCEKHRSEIEEKGPADLVVQFTVHMKGQVLDVSIAYDGRHRELAGLAIQAIKDSPAWNPGTQNGHKVVCYMRQQVSLRL